MRHNGYGTAVAAPVVAGGRTWGLVLVASNAPDTLGPDAERRLGDFAELVALGLESAEAREQLNASRLRILEAGLNERRRLERNLHDGAQQRLVSLAIQLRVLETQLDGDADGGEAARLRRADRARPRDEGAARARPRPAPGDPHAARAGGGARVARRQRGAAGQDHRRDRTSASPRPSRRARTSSSPRASRTRSSTRTRRASRSASSACRADCASRSPTTGAAAPTPRRGPGCAGCRIASRRSAGASRSPTAPAAAPSSSGRAARLTARRPRQRPRPHRPAPPAPNASGPSGTRSSASYRAGPPPSHER